MWLKWQSSFSWCPWAPSLLSVFPSWLLSVDIKLQLGVEYFLTLNEYCFYIWVEIGCLNYFASYYYVVFCCCPQATASFTPIVSHHVILILGFPGGSEVKNPRADSGDVVWSLSHKDSLEEENGNPLQYYCLENSRQRSQTECQTEEPGRLQSMESQRSWTWPQLNNNNINVWWITGIGFIWNVIYVADKNDYSHTYITSKMHMYTHAHMHTCTHQYT